MKIVVLLIFLLAALWIGGVRVDIQAIQETFSSPPDSGYQVVELVSGSRIVGTVRESTESQVTIQIDEGSITLSRDEIVSIQEGEKRYSGSNKPWVYYDPSQNLFSGLLQPTTGAKKKAGYSASAPPQGSFGPDITGNVTAAISARERVLSMRNQMNSRTQKAEQGRTE